MPDYRRDQIPGACYFFTVNLLDRRSDLLVSHIDTLRNAVREVRRRSPLTNLPQGRLCRWRHAVVDRRSRRPAGNVWVANNWPDYNVCFGEASEALLTRCGGNGLTVFYGMAKPVRAPQIGPARGYD